MSTDSPNPAARPYRRTSQTLLPARLPSPRPDHSDPDHYDLYPAHPLPGGQLQLGWDALAARLADARRVTLDGFAGVLWDEVRAGLSAALERLGRRVTWLDVTAAIHPEEAVRALTAPFSGGDDPLFGTRYTGRLADFFDAGRLSGLQPDAGADLSIILGPGAALAHWDGPLVYLDLPKNEVQFRARAGVPTNLGVYEPDPKRAYKRAYFVDWPALAAHKAALLPRLDLLVDAQRPDEPTLIGGAELRSALTQLAHRAFRVRPWFEPGPWGGQWIREQVPQLPQDVPNYAWSFELISPENGLLLTAGGLLLECSFDLLMFQAGEAVLGDAWPRFGHEFPIRFDWLDTVRGGNLSLQVHPAPDYIRSHFGETFTQDETYYILEAQPQASVYLGFQAGVDPAEFRNQLERSAASSEPVEVERFVQRHPAARHDLFLIPHGTVHCSGEGSVVLEISATPYIFTFKLYDWLRLDLEGRPRPLNLERAFQNLSFARQGEAVRRELISQPRLHSQGPGWRRLHLPTHPDHFYDIQRLEFTGQLTLETGGQAQVLAVVEGAGVTLEVSGHSQRFAYAETFVVPAAAGRYTLHSAGDAEVKVILAFVRPVSPA